MALSDTATLKPEAAAAATREPEAMPGADDALYRTGRRYFTIAVLIGIGVMAIPFLWVLYRPLVEFGRSVPRRPKRLLL